MPYNPDSEDALELAVMALFETLGWETVRAYHEAFTPAAATPGKPYLGRSARNQIILAEPLRAALARLNPGLPEEALGGALGEISRSRAALSLGRANQEL